MPRRMVGELNAAQVARKVKDVEEGKAPPGMVRVGGVGSLCLHIKRRKAGVTTSWILRATVEGRRADLGLGSWPAVTLLMARERARKVSDEVWAGKNPFKTDPHRWAPPADPKPAKVGLTFAAAAERYSAERLEPVRAPKELRAWASTMERWAFKTLGEVPVAEVATKHILEVLRQDVPGKGEFWVVQNETANRLLSELRAVLSWATVSGLRTSDNPAVWRGHLDKVLPSPTKVRKPASQPALGFGQLPSFVASLRARDASSSREGLLFLILTASRSGEVRGATWDEVDLDKGLWTIPAARMKASRDHRVALSKEAVALLKAQPIFASSPLIFPGRTGGPMSDDTLNVMVERMHEAEVKAGRPGWKDLRSGKVVVPHGFRSTFRDWAAEMTDFPPELAEMALAHAVGSAVERAYRRGDQLEKRRDLAQAWADFALGAETDVQA